MITPLNIEIMVIAKDIHDQMSARTPIVNIANVIRMCLRFGNMATLEDGYGINLLPLATFAMEAYGDDPWVKPYVLSNGCIWRTRSGKHVPIDSRSLGTNLPDLALDS